MSENKSEQSGKRAAPRSAWKPGQSGNPGGRPRVVADIRALAQQEGPASIEALKRVRDDPKSPPAAVALAANSLLDRGYGKPLQSHDVRHQIASAVAPDTDLIAIATASSGVVASSPLDSSEPEGVVH